MGNFFTFGIIISFEFFKMGNFLKKILLEKGGIFYLWNCNKFHIFE